MGGGHYANALISNLPKRLTSSNANSSANAAPTPVAFAFWDAKFGSCNKREAPCAVCTSIQGWKTSQQYPDCPHHIRSIKRRDDALQALALPSASQCCPKSMDETKNVAVVAIKRGQKVTQVAIDYRMPGFSAFLAAKISRPSHLHASISSVQVQLSLIHSQTLAGSLRQGVKRAAMPASPAGFCDRSFHLLAQQSTRISCQQTLQHHFPLHPNISTSPTRSIQTRVCPTFPLIHANVNAFDSPLNSHLSSAINRAFLSRVCTSFSIYDQRHS